jgi:hypothetical protein
MPRSFADNPRSFYEANRWKLLLAKLTALLSPED